MCACPYGILHFVAKEWCYDNFIIIRSHYETLCNCINFK